MAKNKMSIATIANKRKNKMSVFAKNRQTEFTFLLGIFAGLVLFVPSWGKIDLIHALALCILFSWMSQALLRVLHGKNRLIDISSQQEVGFNGGIKDFVLALYDMEFILEKKVGDFYIFRTTYSLLPKSELVVIENGEKCFMHGQRIIIKLLSEQISLEELPKKSKIKNNKTPNHRNSN
jgi:hypothetical protein